MPRNRALRRRPSNALPAAPAAPVEPQDQAPSNQPLEFFITIVGNVGRDSVAFPLQAAVSIDSDAEPCGGDSASIDYDVMSHRTKASLTRYGLNVKMSASACQPGNGLFAAKPLPVGYEIPAKGPWFANSADLASWLGTMHPLSETQAKTKIVKAYFKANPDAPAVEHFKALTGVVGFANDYTNIGRAPNAALQLDPNMPQGEQNLKLRIITPVAAEAEIVYNYGTLADTRVRKRAVRKASTAKTTAVAKSAR